MAALDFSHLSQEERLDLIGALWDSLDAHDAPLTVGQRVELRRRRTTLESDMVNGRDLAEVMAALRLRHG
jgi:putative addiction module component (TIGR02574 family)